jgi:hypothetical protein
MCRSKTKINKTQSEMVFSGFPISQRLIRKSHVITHTAHCHLSSDFLLLFSLLLEHRRIFSAGSGFDRLLDEASGLFVLNFLTRSGSDVRISSFFTSSMSDAVVGSGESRSMDCELFVLFRGLLHNVRWFSFSSLLFGDSQVASTSDVIDAGGVGLRLQD